MVADGHVPPWSAVRVLVTGGAGFIGSHLVDRLVEEGADVVVLDDLSTGFIENLNPSADLRVAAVTELDSVREMCRGCEVIYPPGRRPIRQPICSRPALHEPHQHDRHAERPARRA